MNSYALFNTKNYSIWLTGIVYFIIMLFLTFVFFNENLYLFGIISFIAGIILLYASIKKLNIHGLKEK